jgi:adenylyltransferase/sulfurtransferase
MVDTRSMRFTTLSYARDPSNPLNGDNSTITDLSGHA